MSVWKARTDGRKYRDFKFAGGLRVAEQGAGWSGYEVWTHGGELSYAYGWGDTPREAVAQFRKVANEFRDAANKYVKWSREG